MTTEFEQIVSSAPQIVQVKLNELKTLRERPDAHPEPSTFHHIQIVTERLMQTENPSLVCAAVLHDICKLDVMSINPETGYPTTPHHADKAVILIRDKSNGVQDWIVSQGGDPVLVETIVDYHMSYRRKIESMDGAIEEGNPERIARKSKKLNKDREKINQKHVDATACLDVFIRADDMLKPFAFAGLLLK